MDSNPPQSVHQCSIELLIWVLAKYKMYDTNETFILNTSCFLKKEEIVVCFNLNS